ESTTRSSVGSGGTFFAAGAAPLAAGGPPLAVGPPAGAPGRFAGGGAAACVRAGAVPAATPAATGWRDDRRTEADPCCRLRLSSTMLESFLSVGNTPSPLTATASK